MEASRPLRPAACPVVAVIALALAAYSTAARAAVPDDAAPIHFGADPEWTVQGGKVKLDGETATDGHAATVTFRITDPKGATSERRASVSTETGTFEIVLERLLVAGRYDVVAIAPDGRGRATGTFSVLTYQEALDQVAGDWEDTVEEAAQAVDRAASELDSLPPSPPKAEAEEKLAELKRELAKRGGDAARFRGALAPIRTLVDQRPDAAPAFAPLLDSLGGWSRELKGRRVELYRGLMESSERGEVCEAIHTAGEGIKMASALLNLAGTAVDIAWSFGRDLLAAGVQSLLPEPARSDSTTVFAVSEVVKAGEPILDGLRQRYGAERTAQGTISRDGGRKQLAGVLVGLCYDLGGLFVDRMFDRFCERLEGPLEASLHVEFSNEAGRVWWKYDLAIRGRLQLRYARGEPGQAVRVRGEFLGTASNFTLWENVLETLDPVLMRGNVAWRRSVLPTVPLVSVEGDYLGALVEPGAFFIPVHGDLTDSRLRLEVDDAKVDFDGIAGRAIYVIAGLRTMGFPVVVEVPFPFKGARFLITRAADAKDGPFELPVTVDRKSNRTVAERVFTRSKVVGDGNVASYEMTIRACSPGC